MHGYNQYFQRKTQKLFANFLTNFILKKNLQGHSIRIITKRQRNSNKYRESLAKSICGFDNS